VYEKYGKKKIGFYETSSGWVGHRFMKLFCKLDFFNNGFPTEMMNDNDDDDDDNESGDC